MESFVQTSDSRGEQKGVLFAAADCTGHGVPGAMVSVVCHNAMNRSVREFGLTEPGKILDKVTELVEETFVKSEEEVKDGMDLAFCSLVGNSLQYAGAHNPLWIIRKGEILETKADKMPIGSFENREPYTTHKIELEPGDKVAYLHRGLTKLEMGQSKKAIKDFNAALQLDQQYIDAILFRGKARIQAYKFEDAIRDFKTVIQHDPENISAYHQMALAKMGMGNYVGAKKDLSVIIELDPKNAEAFYQRGVAFFDGGSRKKACLDWEIAKKLGHPLAGLAIEKYGQ